MCFALFFPENEFAPKMCFASFLSGNYVLPKCISFRLDSDFLCFPESFNGKEIIFRSFNWK
jgi:hypothetical protein